MYDGKIRDMSVLENNYRNLNINELIFSEKNKVDFLSSSLPLNGMKERLLENTLENNDILNKSLLNFYKGKNLKDKKIKDYKNIADIIFKKIIKYKNMGGMQFEISGRLTKRYRADRAKHIKRLFGGLNNLDSSFKRKSSVILRGYMKNNVNYAIYTSKRRIGAFAVKG